MPRITPTRLPGLRAALRRAAGRMFERDPLPRSLLPTTLIALASCAAGLTVTLGTASAFA